MQLSITLLLGQIALTQPGAVFCITTQDMTQMQTQEADGSVPRIFIITKEQEKGQVEGKQRFVFQGRVKKGQISRAGRRSEPED